MSVTGQSDGELSAVTETSRGASRRTRQSFPLIEAKLQPPVHSPASIGRERLVRLLDSQADLPVISVVAPPGYGKTTLLGQWAAQQSRPVAWLTIDDLDNDPSVLVSYLAATLDRVEPLPRGTSAVVGGGRNVLSVALPRLASALHTWPQSGILIVDDAHRLIDRACLDALAALIDHLPPGFRVAIAGRSETGLPFARLRANRLLLEVGPDQLALDTDEATELTRAAGCRLGPDEIRDLHARTEGWPAGIYLATLAIGRGRSQVMSPDQLSGGSGHIAAYLRSEFEDGLADDDVAFLTRSVVLERITSPIAESVTGLPEAGQRLQRLARSNLLIQALPAAAETYRYHNLLRDFLVVELESREPGSQPTLHRRAAAAYEDAGELDLAVEHAIAGRDFSTAARLVVATALHMHYRGRTSTVQRWLQAFDDRTMRDHPPLAVIAAYAHLLRGDGDAADRMAEVAEQANFHGPPGDGSASFASQRAMLRAIMVRNGPEDALANGRMAASLERPGSPWRGIALMGRGVAQLLMGQLAESDASFVEAIDLTMGEAPPTAINSLAMRSSLKMRIGDWDAAAELCGQARDLLDASEYDDILIALPVHAVNARVALHHGNLDLARDSLVRAQLVRPLANFASPTFSVLPLIELCRAYLAISDPAGAQLALREAEQIVRRRPALGTLTDDLGEVQRLLADAKATLVGSSTLTTAELRVLPLLPTYLSFQEIAERLMISRNTVKSHAMSIYGKLWSSSRGEAVERAVEIGLLEPYPALVRATIGSRDVQSLADEEFEPPLVAGPH